MAGLHQSEFKNPVVRWIDERLPLFTMMQKEYGVFPTPRNFNYFWNFGAIAMFMLVTMIVSGIVLAMNYAAHASIAFDSVERIVRDVNHGWLIRTIHSNGASFFFIAVYIHIFRGLYYGSYKKPRELLWILGVIIFLLMMATAFMGYVLPWGQMSFWGATVITNLFSAIPLVGDSVTSWLWGGFAVDNPTLNRFYALHYLLPFIIFAVVFLHIAALHVCGSNNPLGIEPKGPQDTVPFHPFYTVKDSFGLVIFIMIYALFIFWMPDALGHPDNYIPANPMVTPPHIVPEWYFLPFYAILRSITMDFFFIPAKLLGVLAMFGSIALLFVLPWLDTHPVRSASFRPMFRVFLSLLVVDFVILGYCGAKPAEAPYTYISLVATAYYFLFFLVIVPVLSRKEQALPLPKSIAESVLGAKHALVMVLAAGLLAPTLANASEGKVALKEVEWEHKAWNGTYDRAALQRGFQIYKEVCSACHGLRLLSYRDLTGIGFSEAEVKAIAKEYTAPDTDDDGNPIERPAIPADRFKNPFPNDKAARAANNGALPPDFSLIVKAREGHEDYIYSLLTGYGTPPEGVTVMPGMNYNSAFPGHQIAMAQPLSDGQVTFADGAPNDLSSAAKDVAQFLAWAGDPHMEERKRTGIAVMIFLALFAGLMYAVKKKVWKDAH